MSANGIVSGNDSMIVVGCSHDPNWAARMRYMKMKLIPIATKNPVTARPVSFVEPGRRRGVAGGEVLVCDDPDECIGDRALPGARCDVRGDRDLPLPPHSVDLRRTGRRA